MDRDGVIDYDGDDRIVRRNTEVATREGVGVIRTTAERWRETDVTSGLNVSVEEMSVNGLQSWYTDATGAVTHISRTIDRENASSTETTTAPDGSYSVEVMANGRRQSVTEYSENGTQLTQSIYAYDPHGRLAGVTDARNGTTTYSYFATDWRQSVTSPAPTTVGVPLTTQYDYDSRGRVETVTEPDDAQIHREYYGTGDLKKLWGVRTCPVEYTYDHTGRLKTMTTWQDYAGEQGAAVTTWTYSAARGFLISKTYADSHGITYTHTSAGRVLTRVWARGTITTYDYNAAGELNNIDYSDTTPDVAYTYNRLGHRVTVSDGTGTRENVFTASGHLSSVTATSGLLNGLVLTNGYDGIGRRTSFEAAMTGNQGPWTWTQTYDFYPGTSRLRSVSDGNSTAVYSYVADSDLWETLSVSNGAADVLFTTRTYDALNRFTGLTNVVAGETFSADAFTFNSAGQKIRTDLVDGGYWVYTYDELGQLSSGHRFGADGAPVAGQQFGYVFDDIGNRLSTAVDGTEDARISEYSPNQLNQYDQRTVPGFADVLGEAAADAVVTVNNTPTVRQGRYFRSELAVDNSAGSVFEPVSIVGVKPGAGPDGRDVVSEATGSIFIPQTPEQYVYDLDGNLTEDSRWIYTWNAENRLTSMESRPYVPDSVKTKVVFAYDSEGRRVRKDVYRWQAGTSSYTFVSSRLFVYTGWLLVAELDSNADQIRGYTWGLDLSGSFDGAGGIGGLLSVTDTVSSVCRFACMDGSGNVTGLIASADGTPEARYEYSPFGRTLRATGSAVGDCPFGFSTKYTDAETRSVYYGYRYYSTDTGRWLNRDPLYEEGGRNLYGFTQNRPMGSVDPLGLLEERIDGIRKDEARSPTAMWRTTVIGPPNFSREAGLGYGRGSQTINLAAMKRFHYKTRVYYCRMRSPSGASRYVPVGISQILYRAYAVVEQKNESLGFQADAGFSWIARGRNTGASAADLESPIVWNNNKGDYVPTPSKGISFEITFILGFGYSWGTDADSGSYQFEIGVGGGFDLAEFTETTSKVQKVWLQDPKEVPVVGDITEEKAEDEGLLWRDYKPVNEPSLGDFPVVR